jgi:hypothetical protein
MDSAENLTIFATYELWPNAQPWRKAPGIGLCFLAQIRTSSPTMLKFNVQHKGFKSEYYVDGDEVHIGRRQGKHQPDVCLNMDMRVKSRHARMSQQDGDWYIEAMDGRRDVSVNGELIDMPMIVTPSCDIRICQTTVAFEAVVAPKPAVTSEWREVEIASRHANVIVDPLGEQLMLQTRVDAVQDASAYFEIGDERASDKVALLGTLPILMTEADDVFELSRLVLRDLISAIEGAERGAIFMVTANSQEFDLCACQPEGSPPYSRALMSRALTDGHGFIWRVLEDELVTDSIFHLSIASGMYTPLMAGDRLVGALMVDNRRDTDAFAEEDLQFFMAIAQCTAQAMAQRLAT